jgi:hypothetical protein
LLRTVFHTYRKHPRRVFVSAALVFGPAAVADTVLGNYLEHHAGSAPVVAFVLATFSVVSVGETLYAGLLHRLVGRVDRDQPLPRLAEVLRTLPYARLIGADVVLSTVLIATSAILLIPGLVVGTVFALAGPLIVLEDRGVLGAFRRSAQLVVPRFWLAFWLLTVPLLVVHGVSHGVEVAYTGEPLIVVFVVHELVGVTVGSAVALVEISLADRLVFGPALQT